MDRYIILLSVAILALSVPGEVSGLKCFACQYELCKPSYEHFHSFIVECFPPNDAVCMLRKSGEDQYRSCTSKERCVPSKTTFCCKTDLCNAGVMLEPSYGLLSLVFVPIAGVISFLCVW